MLPAHWVSPDWRKHGEIIRERRGELLYVRQKTWFGFSINIYLYVGGLLRPVAFQNILITTNAVNQTYTSSVQWSNLINSVEVIGGGGAGAIGASTTTGGGGGGGGAYNRINNFTFATPGTTTASYRLVVGLLHGGTFPGTAPDCWFNSAAFPVAPTAVGAKGGLSPATSTTATGGTGGLASAGFPTTSPPGRSGGNAGNGASATAGGGGGGAGGPFGAGGNGSGTTGGTADGGKVAGGAAGNPGTSNSGTEFFPLATTRGCGSGAGGSNASGGTGGNGGLYGGGAGGGSRSTGVGGDGAQGIIVLSSVIPDFAKVGDDAGAMISRLIAVGW